MEHIIIYDSKDIEELLGIPIANRTIPVKLVNLQLVIESTTFRQGDLSGVFISKESVNIIQSVNKSTNTEYKIYEIPIKCGETQLNFLKSIMEHRIYSTIDHDYVAYCILIKII